MSKRASIWSIDSISEILFINPFNNKTVLNASPSAFICSIQYSVFAKCWKAQMMLKSFCSIELQFLHPCLDHISGIHLFVILTDDLINCRFCFLSIAHLGLNQQTIWSFLYFSFFYFLFLHLNSYAVQTNGMNKNCGTSALHIFRMFKKKRIEMKTNWKPYVLQNK